MTIHYSDEIAELSLLGIKPKELEGDVFFWLIEERLPESYAGQLLALPTLRSMRQQIKSFIESCLTGKIINIVLLIYRSHVHVS
ncbi:MAG: hypothetical protein NZ585_13000 [Chloracidobacterium sp.]|nr:hypothetical protein [Chloracidobacterium sp.]MDW8217794.1 hypothetical protein [Acidobacteriota bacterium]